MKHRNNEQSLFKLNNKDIITISLTSFPYVYWQIWTEFTCCSGIFIAKFEQVTISARKIKPNIFITVWQTDGSFNSFENWNHFYLHEDTQLGNFKLKVIGSVSKTLSNICLKTFFPKKVRVCSQSIFTKNFHHRYLAGS